MTIMLCLMTTPALAQVPHPLYRETWYELLLKKFNRKGFDYGRWLEERRKGFLQATVTEPRFWYSLLATLLALFLMAVCTKLSVDNRRRMQAAAEMMADLYSHDLYSRRVAGQAIERHNQHIEQCNRAAEMSGGAAGRPGWGETEIDSLKAELQHLTSQLEMMTQDRNKLQQELRQKSIIVADLSTRLDNLARKLTPPRNTAATDEPAPGIGDGDSARFVGQINRLQEELYAERHKNKRLKSA
ncbi:MAG: hypothetical protein WAN10_01310 [Candidatus Acidiferrales bacterium]